MGLEIFFVFFVIPVLLVLVVCRYCLRVCNEWERKVVLFLGRFNGVRGPGLFFLIPFLETTPFTVDLRTITNAVSAEETLTKDNVPVNVDTVIYWRVVEPKRAVLEVADYSQAVIGAAQTALRDIIGRSDLSMVLSDRAGLDSSMTTSLDAQTEPWGIKVEAVQMREIKIPDGLQDAMSRVAQAERESQARILLGDSELTIAQRFANAGKVYEEHPIALHLRGMNMLYEVMKSGNASTVIVPSSAVDSMSFGGYTGLAALSQEQAESE